MKRRMDKILFNLTPEQKKLFTKLMAAYRACEKAGITMVNNYGTLEAYQSSQVEGYADDSIYDKNALDVIASDEGYALHRFKIPNEWTDDRHLIKLTPKGVKELLEDHENL